jgi:hypothetical protein
MNSNKQMDKNITKSLFVMNFNKNIYRGTIRVTCRREKIKKEPEMK